MFCQISIKLLLFILKINYTNMEAATKKGPTIVLEDRCYSKFVTISTTQDISYIFIKIYIYMLPLVSWPITTFTSHQKKKNTTYKIPKINISVFVRKCFSQSAMRGFGTSFKIILNLLSVHKSYILDWIEVFLNLIQPSQVEKRHNPTLNNLVSFGWIIKLRQFSQT